VLILLATIYGVFRGEDMGELKDALAQCRTGWIVCAAGCVLAFILCDAANLYLLLDSFGMGLRQGTCFFSAAVGFFFAAITPSSSGGQPMQIYYLREKGIPVSVSTVALMVMSVAYKLVLVLLGLVLALFGRGVLREYLGGMMFLFHIGMLLTAGFAVFLLLMLFRPGAAKGILIWGMSVLEELRIMKKREERQTELEVAMDLYGDAAQHVKDHPKLMLSVFGLMILRRAALFTVTWCVYRALGLSGAGWPMIALLQAVIAICADMLPLPGGMGISEGLFMKVFAPAFGALVVPGVLLSRGIGHYGQLIFCAVFTLIAAASMNREREE